MSSGKTKKVKKKITEEKIEKIVEKELNNDHYVDNKQVFRQK
jgi:hypothetical protein